jgi:hypothetical protein
VITGVGGGCVEARRPPSSLELLRCDGTAEQRWTAAPDGTLRAAGLCMSVEGGQADGSAVRLAACSGAGTQQWRTGAGGSLVNPQSGRCLDGPNNPGNSPRLEIWRCTGGEYQRWSIPG